jgi:N-acyl homoserine lactone hydrolase
VQQDTIRRLYVLDFGLFKVHENGREIGIPGFLLQTHGGANILVDSGFPAKYAGNADQATLEDGLESFGSVLELTEEHLPAAQLARIGLTCDDIDTLIITHTDIDHVGGIGDFPGATIVIGGAERAYPRPRYWNDRSPIEWPDNAYRIVDQDCDLCAGVTLLTTPGHAPGHLSLLVHLPQTGPVLLVGDAISRPAEMEEGFGGAWDEDLARASAKKVMDLVRSEGALAIYGHDPEQWPGLLKAPLYYA